MGRHDSSRHCLYRPRRLLGRASLRAFSQDRRRVAGRLLPRLRQSCRRARRRLGSARLRWAHARRPFYEFHAATKSPLAGEALARIAKLHEIETDIPCSSADQRRATRQQRSRPIVEALHAWLGEQLPQLSGASPLVAAMRYALRHWSDLVWFLDDGRIKLDSNMVECGIRPVALTRKIALFAGGDAGAEHWAIAMTVNTTKKLNGVEPRAWLTVLLRRLVSGRSRQHELAELLPWNWRPPDALAQAAQHGQHRGAWRGRFGRNVRHRRQRITLRRDGSVRVRGWRRKLLRRRQRGAAQLQLLMLRIKLPTRDRVPPGDC